MCARFGFAHRSHDRGANPDPHGIGPCLVSGCRAGRQPCQDFRPIVRTARDSAVNIHRRNQGEHMTSIGTMISTESKHNGDTSVLSPDSRFLAAPGASNTVVVLDALTRELWVTYYGHQAAVYRRVAGTIKALAWLPDGTFI